MKYMDYIIPFFSLGLLIGSFLNVVSFRADREESFVSGRSKCLSCGHQLAWYDNIPVLSYIFLRGHCRYCQVSLSWQYPIVELVTGGLFALVGMLFFDSFEKVTWLQITWLLSLVSLLLLIVTSDLKAMEISFSSLLLLNFVTLFYLLVYHALFEEQDISLWQTQLVTGLLGGLFAWLLFFCLAYFSQETWMGWGDVWLSLAAGMSIGWHLVLPFLTLAFGLGAFYGVGLLLLRGRGMKTQVPFAPFLAVSLLVILILNQAFPTMLTFVSL